MATISLSNSIFKLCTPALIYLVISVLVLVFLIFSGISALTLIMKSALIVLWTFLLNWLCSRGLAVLSWIILLLPVVLIVLLASWSVDVQSRVVPSWSHTSMGNAAKVGGCSSCREGIKSRPTVVQNSVKPQCDASSYEVKGVWYNTTRQGVKKECTPTTTQLKLKQA